MPKDMTSVRHDRLTRVMALLQTRVKASHNELYTVGEYHSERTFQNDLYYLRGIYGADISYNAHEKLYILNHAGMFHINLKISRSEVEALSAGLKMTAHFLPHLEKAASSIWKKLEHYVPNVIISCGNDIVHSTLTATPAAPVNAEVFNTLIEAKRAHMAVNILYAAPQRMPKQWVISPYDFYAG